MTFPQFNSSVILPQVSGSVECLQNDLTLMPSTSGDVIIARNGLRPETDGGQNLGNDFLRWATVRAVNADVTRVDADSGILAFGSVNLYSLGVGSAGTLSIADSFTTLSSSTVEIGGASVLLTGQFRMSTSSFAPLVEGNQRIGALGFVPTPFEAMFANSGVFKMLQVPTNGADENILVSGHLNPVSDLTFQLGSATERWERINAGSGVFANDITAGGGITATGAITGTTLESLSTLIVGTNISAGGNVGGVTATATVAAFGVLLGNVLVTNSRAELSLASATGVGSGYALRNENRWDHNLRTNSEAINLTNLTMSMDGLSTRPWGVPLRERLTLQDNFAMITTHAGTAPSDWTVLLRRTQSDGTTEGTDAGYVASGVFGWNASADTIEKTLGVWSTSGNTPVQFEPGSCYDVVVHNDGTAGSVDGPVMRLSLGLTVDTPNLGRGY